MQQQADRKFEPIHRNAQPHRSPIAEEGNPRLHTARALVRWLPALAGFALLVASPIMIGVDVSGQHQVTDQLTAQQITFPAKASSSLPADQAAYAGQQVTTGDQAKAFYDIIETHIKEATGGLTYSQVSTQYKASSAASLTKLSGERQTAFMGESPRDSLLSAYQAWRVTYPVIGLRHRLHRPRRTGPAQRHRSPHQRPARPT
jgi:hypothetical protein